MNPLSIFVLFCRKLPVCAAMLAVIVLAASEAFADRFGATTYYSPPRRILAPRDFVARPGDMPLPPGAVWEPAAPVYRDDAPEGSVCRADRVFAPRQYGKPAWMKRIRLDGWLEGGFYLNAHGSTSRPVRELDRREHLDRFQKPLDGNSALLGNVRSTDVMLNQLYFGVTRDLATRRGFDWGFKADFLFGSDGWMAQSFGDASFDYGLQHRDYYVSIPQLYASLGCGKWSVKAGKFQTLLGYEKLEARDTFFYSRSNLFYTEPQTHGGILAEYRCRPELWFSFGYVQGADTGLANRFGDHGFLGGVYWRALPNVTVWYTLYAASHGDGFYRNEEHHPGGSVYQHSFVVNWKFASRCDYSFQWNLGSRRGRGEADDATWFGTAHYFSYRIDARLKAGLRFDQVHSNGPMHRSGFGRSHVAGYYDGDLYGLTLGLNWTPYTRIEVRPEIRYDHAADCRPFDGGRKSDQFSAGCGFLYRF